MKKENKKIWVIMPRGFANECFLVYATEKEVENYCEVNKNSKAEQKTVTELNKEYRNLIKEMFAGIGDTENYKYYDKQMIISFIEEYTYSI